MSLVEQASNRIAVKIASILNVNDDEKDIICYGAFCTLQTILSFFWIVLFGIIFHVLPQSLLVVCTIAALRKYSGGQHATAPSRCMIITTFISTSFGLVIKNIFVNFNIALIVSIGVLCFIISFCLVFKFAPADTGSKPISDKNMIYRLKKNSILIVCGLVIIDILLMTFYFKYYNTMLLNLAVCIYMGVIWQSFTLTPIGYKTLYGVDLLMKNMYSRQINT